MFDRRHDCREHLLGQLALVERIVAKIGAELRCLFGQTLIRNDRRQVKSRVTFGHTIFEFQEVDATYQQFVEPAHPEFGHDHARLFCNEPEEIDDHLREPDEILAAQHVVLGGDTGGAVIEMADTQVLAAQRHHRRRAEAETLGAEHRSLDDVEASLQATVRLQPHLVPQVIAAQHLVGLGQTELPRASGILH